MPTASPVPSSDRPRRLDPVTHADLLLLGPGPSTPYPEVMEAFTRPVLGHLDRDFLVVLDEIADHWHDVRLEELRTLGKERIRAAYQWDAVTDQYEQLVQRLAARRKAAR